MPAARAFSVAAFGRTSRVLLPLRRPSMLWLGHWSQAALQLSDNCHPHRNTETDENRHDPRLPSRPRQVREALRREREAVLTANGRPVALMIPVDAGSIDRTLETLRRARARGASRDPRREPSDDDEGHRRDHRPDPQSAIPRRGMRIVVDTKVLIAGLLSAAGPFGWIVEAVLAGDLELAFDAAIRQEYEEVMRRPGFRFAPARIDEILAALDHFGFVVIAAPPWPIALPDPDDEPFLAVAQASESVLVTGNLRHFPVRGRGEVAVLNPRELMHGFGGVHATPTTFLVASPPDGCAGPRTSCRRRTRRTLPRGR
jgi:putative PIN family toxin of toxin-antitoxin system